jgi:glycosyltransferase involved in cell wall biosynthesis
LEQKTSIIATVINDVVYDQRMIRICTSLSKKYKVSLWGRRKSEIKEVKRPFKQKRTRFLFSGGPLFYLEYNIRLFLRLMITRFDIVHAVDLDTLPAGYLACRLKGKKLVYDSHEYFTEVPELVSRPRTQKIWLAIERYFLPKVEHALTVGEKIAQEYRRLYGVEFKVVRNCPLLKETTPITDEPRAYLLYQGALNKGRGLEASILAMHNIDMPLKIAGSGDLDEELKQLVEKENLEHKVEFLGLIKPEDLVELTTKAYAGINISENLGLSYYYSLNNKYFDYIHAGIPAVTNDFPEYQELNEKYHTSILVHAIADEIAQAVNLLIHDKTLYSQLKKNTFIARQELNWQKEESVLLKIYDAFD